MAKDRLPLLNRFHPEVVRPDVQRATGEQPLETNERFAGLDADFDSIAKRFDELEAASAFDRLLQNPTHNA